VAAGKISEDDPIADRSPAARIRPSEGVGSGVARRVQAAYDAPTALPNLPIAIDMVLPYTYTSR
jgi:hypothetical protein